MLWTQTRHSRLRLYEPRRESLLSKTATSLHRFSANRAAIELPGQSSPCSISLRISTRPVRSFGGDTKNYQERQIAKAIAEAKAKD
jgi:hypothetical protein